MRDHYDEIRGRGADVAAVGTGNFSYARSFVEDEGIPYLVLSDDDAEAAQAADVGRVGFLKLFDPASYAGTLDAWRQGHRIGMPGKRTTQLGATLVLGPGSKVRYAHYDAHTADHAPLTDVLAAVA